MKEKILAMLREDERGYVSGEEISERLGISRTAVWKHISELRRRGYVIEASTRKGYRILSSPDILYPWEVRPLLKTKIFGKKLAHFMVVDSTNTEAKELAEKGAREGTVVISEEQKKGRGRLGRGWHSPKGGIWISLILRPRIQPHRAMGTTLLSAAAVCEAVMKVTGLRVSIKWPNDLLIEGRKVCGILTEMKAETDLVQYIIQGVGLNANLDEKDLGVISETATSLKIMLGRSVDRKMLLAEILYSMESMYDAYLRGDFDEVMEKWKKWNCTLGRHLTLKQGDREYYGLAVDVTPEGGLILEDPSGERRTFYSGEVTVKKQ